MVIENPTLEDKQQIEVGDSVVHSMGIEEPFYELVESITHNHHPHRRAKDIYCEINKLFWYYDDIIKIKKKS